MTRPPLRRTVRLGMRGLDVEAHTAAMHRYLRDGQLKTYREQRPAVRQTFGVGKRALAKKAAAKAGLPAHGVVGPALYDAMWKAKAYDEKCKQLLAQDAEAQKPKLVEPNQGWGSLHESLWEAYSEGRRRNFTDLGTYVNKPGDHGVGPPCYAFDLGRADRFLFKGWGYLAARRLALYYVKHQERLNVEYVILGRQLWSRQRPYWHPLTTGDTSHDFHIHVSGAR